MAGFIRVLDVSPDKIMDVVPKNVRYISAYSNYTHVMRILRGSSIHQLSIYK